MREALLRKGLIGKDRRVGKLSFWETSFTFSGVVFSTPLFLLWHRRLGHVSSPRLRYFISTGMLGSVPNIEISTCMGCKLRKDSALPLLILSFFYFFFWSCVRNPFCLSVIERRPYMSFLTEEWKNWLKSRFSVLLLEVTLPSELCLLQLTSFTKRFPNDPAPTLLSRMELPSGSIAIYWRQLALSCSLLLSLVNFWLKLFWLLYIFWTEYLPLLSPACLFLRENLLPRRTMKSFESIGRGCGGNPRGFV